MRVLALYELSSKVYLREINIVYAFSVKLCEIYSPRLFVTIVKCGVIRYPRFRPLYRVRTLCAITTNV